MTHRMRETNPVEVPVRDQNLVRVLNFFMKHQSRNGCVKISDRKRETSNPRSVRVIIPTVPH